MSKLSERLKRLVAGVEDRHAFKLESAILKFTRLLRQMMDKNKITPNDLAVRIEAKPPYISKILRGQSNFTLDSIIKLCSAVDSEFVFDVIPKGNQQWNSLKTVHIDLTTANILSCYIQTSSSVHSSNRLGSNPPMLKTPNYDRCILS